METGKVIEFWENKRIMAAVCLESRGERLHILTEQNREASLSSNRVINCSDYRVDPALSRDELVVKLKLIVERRNRLKEETNVNELWELLQGEGDIFTGEKLAELWFGKQTSSDGLSAMQRALSEDKIYFKQKGEKYILNPQELVEQYHLKLEREKEKERETEEVSQWLRQIWSGKKLPLTQATERFVENLKQIAVFGSEAAEYKRGREILERAELSPNLAFRILVKLGIWREDQNLIPYKYFIPITFPAKVYQEVERIRQLSSNEEARENEERIDLNGIDIFSIDSESTLDIDDALSLEEEDCGWNLGIHIADAAHYIKIGSSLDETAMERATSIYLPENKIPMLPSALSEDLISLNPDGKKRAISLLVRVNPEAEVLDFSFIQSWVMVKRRLSYEEVDSSLTRDNKLRNLYELALKLRQKRLQAGAKNFTAPEVEITVDENRKITLVKRERETPSQILVSECMILANNLAAVFCRSKGIPIIYRSQLKPAEDFPATLEYDPVLYFRLRRLLSRAELTITPKPHAGLGLDNYTNFTSPIRRYVDLVVERQIGKFLRGEEDIYSEEDLKNITFVLEPSLSRANAVQQESRRYWLLKYLENYKGELISALVLDVLFNRLIICLEQYLLETEISLRGGKEVRAGDRILVRLEGINASENFIKLSLA